MLVLAIDTSTDRTAVALVRDGQVIAEDADAALPEGEAPARHGDVILPKIAAQLQAAGVAPAALDLIGVGLGPGSFTGLRVGLATAKGLALAAGVPLRGVSSLEVIARGAFEAARGSQPGAAPPEQVFVVLDAGRGELYGAGYAGASLAPVMAGERAAAAELIARVAQVAHGDCLLCGSGVRSHGAALRAALPAARFADPGHDLPAGHDLAQAAAEAFARSGPSDLGGLEPIYLRDSDAKLPAKPLAV
jgi:tRNA threonylcarbamoyladenosine biosynthesis protein TsaB